MPTGLVVLAFMAAAGVGALARVEAGRRWNEAGRFPFGTFAVNVSGSFLLGLFVAVAAPLATVLGVAALGAYTTFSSFAGEAASLAQQRGLPFASWYVGTSLAAGVTAAAAGIALAS